MSTQPRNILFIMADQLRADYLGCYGHASLTTPNIDALAAGGVRFNRAYAQSPVCGASRMSFYTGRYVSSHGATWNDVPLRADEWTLGDHLDAAGLRTLLVGKTHMRADIAGMTRLGIDPGSPAGRRIAECGFELFEREEGIYLDGWVPERRFGDNYNSWLRERGYAGENPWHEWANSVEVDGRPVSGWYLDTAHLPARIAEEHSETPYLTHRALECIDALGSQPWCIHLSYIKPHWPYVAPAPYHSLYSAEDIQPPQRSVDERSDTHPVFAAFQDMRVARAFSDDAVRTRVVPAYMGLIKQLDDQIGVLMAGLRERGLADNTMVIFTSDHGDYLGDHWLGEKDFLHEPSARIPLIVVDPSKAADPSRGSTNDRLVEAIDLVPTIVDWTGGDAAHPGLEGRSLLPLLHGHAPEWRSTAFSEYDYSTLPVRRTLNQPIASSNIVAAICERWKLIYCPGHRPMLFDLVEDPFEYRDLGGDPNYSAVRADLTAAILEWALRSRRVTESDQSIERRTDTQVSRGILLGLRNAAEHAQVLAAEQERATRAESELKVSS